MDDLNFENLQQYTHSLYECVSSSSHQVIFCFLIRSFLKFVEWQVLCYSAV